MQDHCAFCGHSISSGVQDRMWERMASAWGKVAAGNYCRDGGEHELLAQREYVAVAAYLAHRQATDERWESEA